jgi:membrane protease YdiL (CAAX protease family)
LSAIVGVFFIDPETKELTKSPAASAAMFVPLWIAFAVTIFKVSVRRQEHPLGRRPAVRAHDLLWFLFGIGAQFAVGIAYSLLPINPDDVSKPAREIFDRANENRVGLLLLGIAVGIGAPIMEELFYRGVVHRGFALLWANKNGAIWRVAPLLISSAIFASIHFQPLQFPALFAIGALCAYGFQKTSRIATAMAVHAGFNLTSVVALSFTILSNK